MVNNLGEWFHQNQGPKTRNQDMQLTGDRRDSAQQAALRAPHQYSHGNAAGHACCVSAAVPERHAQRRLLCAVASVPYRLCLLDF